MVKRKNQPKGKLEKPDNDYYLEDGLVVFTAHYHLKRGYCCGCKCRHCPYGKPMEKRLGNK